MATQLDGPVGPPLVGLTCWPQAVGGIAEKEESVEKGKDGAATTIITIIITITPLQY